MKRGSRGEGEEEKRKKMGEGKSAVWSKRPRARGSSGILL